MVEKWTSQIWQYVALTTTIACFGSMIGICVAAGVHKSKMEDYQLELVKEFNVTISLKDNGLIEVENVEVKKLESGSILSIQGKKTTEEGKFDVIITCQLTPEQVKMVEEANAKRSGTTAISHSRFEKDKQAEKEFFDVITKIVRGAESITELTAVSTYNPGYGM